MGRTLLHGVTDLYTLPIAAGAKMTQMENKLYYVDLKMDMALLEHISYI